MQVAWFILTGIVLLHVLPKMVKDVNERKRQVAELEHRTAEKQRETAQLNLRAAEANAKARQKLTDQ